MKKTHNREVQSFRLHPKIRMLLDTFARKTGVKKTRLMEIAIKDFLEKQDGVSHCKKCNFPFYAAKDEKICPHCRLNLNL